MDTVLAAQVRSGLVETSHPGAVAVVAGDGSLIARHGDIERPFYLRSSAKPFQAHVSRQSGADFDTQELAMACASHRGFPAHVALVEAMLHRVGLDEDALQCPPAWPLSDEAARARARAGDTKPRRIWHNCSGKHAGFLMACVARDWPVSSYLDPEHPLQRQVVEYVSEVGRHRAEPVGIDGCGAPVLRTTVRAMGTMFARLAMAPELDDVFAAMHRYPALISVNGQGDTEISIATHSAAKGGAAGCLGVAMAGRYGIGVKSWDGNGQVASLAAVAVLHQLRELTPTAEAALGAILHPPVLGGGVAVGRYESRFRLEHR